MGCVNIQCLLQWVQFEKGRMDGLGAGGGGAAEGKFPGQGNQRLSRQSKKPNTPSSVLQKNQLLCVRYSLIFFFSLLVQSAVQFAGCKVWGWLSFAGFPAWNLRSECEVDCLIPLLVGIKKLKVVNSCVWDPSHFNKALQILKCFLEHG